MKLKLMVGLLSIIMFSCNTKTHNKKKVHKDIFNDYIVNTNNLNFSAISNTISDSIKVLEGKYTVVSNKTEFYKIFQWDSVFSPEYKILEVKEDNGLLQAIVSKECKRIRFLHDEPTVSKITISFSGDKIVSINTQEYKVFNYKKWQSRRDTLVVWVKTHHPELNGFIHDQTLQGGLDYLKAIELYENK